MDRHPGLAVDLSSVRCRNPPCPDRRRLELDPEPGWARCAACGKRWGSGDLFRPYSQVTGGLIIASAVMASYGWTHEIGTARWVLLGVVAVQWVVILRRILYQSRTIKGLRAAR